MIVLLFVTAVFCAVAFMLGRASRLNRSIKRGDAIVDLDTGEVFDPDSREYRHAIARGAVKFK